MSAEENTTLAPAIPRLRSSLQVTPVDDLLDRRWVQGGGVAGILSVVLIILAFVFAGGSPANTVSTEELTRYLVTSRGSILAGTVVLIAAAALFLWFGATLSRLLHDRDRRSPLGLLVLVADVAMVGLMLWDGLTLTVLAFLAGQPDGTADPAVLRAFYDLNDGLLMPGAFGFIAAIFLAALGLAMVRGVFAARWLGYVSLVLMLFALAGGVLGLTRIDGGTVSPISIAPAIGTTLIMLLSSIFMVRYRAPDAAPAIAGQPPQEGEPLSAI